MNKFYTGVGSRDTPQNILKLMTIVACELEKYDYVLRSGGAAGADSAFEAGVKDNAMKEIYIPWKGFNDSRSKFYNTSEEAFGIAERLHPAWDKCSSGAKKLHARNIHQVMGKDLVPKNFSEFLICYTEGGKIKGGTATSIKLAMELDIPVYNLGVTKDYEEVLERLDIDKDYNNKLV